MADDTTHLRTIVNEDGAAVLDTKRGTISTLNVTGGFIWQALARGEGEETIVASLARETGQSPGIIERDVRDFVASLEAWKISPR